MSSEWLGWFASLVLVATIGYQVLNQWRTGSSRGVSPWLFVGQFVASASFAVYAGMIGNSIFVVTNGLLAASGVAGLLVCRQHRKRAADESHKPHLHHIALAAEDWVSARAFYESALGATAYSVFCEDGLRVALLDLGGTCHIELFETPARTSRPAVPCDQPGAEDAQASHPGSLLHLALEVADVDAATARLRQLGARIQKAPQDTSLTHLAGTPLRARFSFLRGPSNELIELINLSPH